MRSAEAPAPYQPGQQPLGAPSRHRRRRLSASSAAKRLRKTYRISLLAIATLTVLAHVVLHFNLEHSVADAKVINVAGRQRMLSQRSAKLALQLERAIRRFPRDLSKRRPLVEDLGASFARLTDSHRRLRAGPLDQDLRAPQSPEVLECFAALQPEFEGLQRGVQHLIESAQSTDPEEAHAALGEILVAEAPFLIEMNTLVGVYEQIARERIVDFSRMEQVLAILTLLLLAAEAIWILEPSVRWLRDQIRTEQRLQDQEQATQHAREDTLRMVAAGFQQPLVEIGRTCHGMQARYPELRGLQEIGNEAARLLRKVEGLVTLEQQLGATNDAGGRSPSASALDYAPPPKPMPDVPALGAGQDSSGTLKALARLGKQSADA